MADVSANTVATSNAIIKLTQLTAASTATGAIILKHISDSSLIYANVLFAVTIASIDTSVDVIVQGSLDNVNWFNLDEDEGVEQYTSNGTYGIRYEGRGEILYIRLYCDDEVGGTGVTVDSKAKIYGKPLSTVS